MITLTDEQQQATNRIKDWHEAGDELEFKLGGYAGTGKTTIIKTIKEQFEAKTKRSVVVSAFTGKAVNVLQRKGLRNAQTLHSLMYHCEPLPGGGVEFHLREKLEAKPNLVIVDEASMISTDLYNDLKSFDIPVLFVGDPGQLEPVGDNPNLMREPDVTLQTIHRQAESSPIIRFATKIRNGGAPSDLESEELRVCSKKGFSIPIAATFRQVICAKNKTRKDINTRFRLMQQLPANEIRVGDKLIILCNNRSCLVFNGMIIFVETILETKPDYWLVDLKDELDKPYPSVPIWKRPFEEDLPKEFVVPKLYRKGPDDGIPYIVADFGYCITCHKSQGSEWETVLVWDEWMPPQVWDMKRWRYTAITRASQHLTYCL